MCVQLLQFITIITIYYNYKRMLRRGRWRPQQAEVAGAADAADHATCEYIHALYGVLWCRWLAQQTRRIVATTERELAEIENEASSADPRI